MCHSGKSYNPAMVVMPGRRCCTWAGGAPLFGGGLSSSTLSCAGFGCTVYGGVYACLQEHPLTVVNLPKWVTTHTPPPSAVGNKMVLDKGQLKVMVVWGPNDRTDYHVEEGEVGCSQALCACEGGSGARCNVLCLEGIPERLDPPTRPLFSVRRSCSCSWWATSRWK